jgi:hypothetical protein
MTTAYEIITRAAKSLNILGSAEVLSAEDASDGLSSLNSLLQTWASETLMVYQLSLENFSLISGQNTYTIGTGGNFNTTRPVTVDSGYVRWNQIDYPLSIVNTDQYDGIPLKSSPNQIPYVLYVDAGFPLTTLKLFQTPNDNSAVIYLELRKPFTVFTSLTDVINMPPGYDRALQWNLALEIAPSFGIMPDPMTVRHAATSKKWLKRTNWQPLVQELDPAIPTGRGFYDQTGNYIG